MSHAPPPMQEFAKGEKNNEDIRLSAHYPLPKIVIALDGEVHEREASVHHA